MEEIASNPVVKQILKTIQAGLDYPIFGATVGQLLLALIVMITAFKLRRSVAAFILNLAHRIYRQFSDSPSSIFLKALNPPAQVLSIVIGLMIVKHYVLTGDDYGVFLGELIQTLNYFAFFWALYRTVEPLLKRLNKRSRAYNPAVTGLIIAVGKMLIIVVGTSTILEIWGIKVGPILAGFGLVGAAVALGAQDLFRNLIGGIFIIAEKRFQIGDSIFAQGVCEGVVEKIGLRTTKIRGFDMSPIFVPNALLSDNPIINNSQMHHRRISWIIGLTYGTSIVQLRQIRDEIKDYIMQSRDFQKPPEGTVLVRVDGFGDSAINLKVYCFATTHDWGKWLETKENLAFAISNIVNEAGSSFAFPSRSIYVESAPDDTMTAVEAESSKTGSAKIDSTKTGSTKIDNTKTNPL